MGDTGAGLRVEFVSCGTGPRAPGWISAWRDLPFVLLEWPLRGRWRIETAGHPTRLIDRHELVLVPAGMRHRFGVVGSEPLVTLWVMLEATIARRQAIAVDQPIFLDGEAAGRIRAHGDRLRRVPAGTTALRDLVHRDAVLARLLDDLLGALPDDRLCAEPTRDDPLAAWVDAHLALRITRSAMARAAGCSVRHLHRRCKEALGCSPQAFVSRERLRRARELLAGTELPVAAVAARCGFADHHYFSRWFRRESGATASAFRAACASVSAGGKWRRAP